MYSKFENFMKKYLAPLADKMDKEVHLSAVKKAMVAMTPLLIIGSFCLNPRSNSKYDWRKTCNFSMDLSKFGYYLYSL